MDNLIDLFCFVNDFCQKIEPWLEKQLIESGVKKRKDRDSRLSLSEIMTLIIHFHQSRYRDFKSYYLKYVQKYLLKFFPDLLSYSRFVEIMPKALLPLTLLVHFNEKEYTKIYFVDSTPIEVCHVKREKSNKVFKNLAVKSKSTKGWYFGFKLHIITNNKGEIMSFKLTKANVDDRKVVNDLTKNLTGKLVGDKGYISEKLFLKLLKKGLHLITKMKKNMKNKLIPLSDKILLKSRGIIESVIGQLKNICQIEHSRHRNTTNFFVNMISGIAAYNFKAKKPQLRENLMTNI